ncbi:MAG: transposase [Methylococcaceae bacterium]
MGCAQVADALHFKKTRLVDYHGKPHWQWVAEAPISITRKARPSQKKQKKPEIPGVPVAARLVVSRILSNDGEILAEWLLMTNVVAVEASDIALWYYWRWQIECFFKLLKKAGHDLESWQQETGLAISKRLLVVSMACVVVWEIAAATGEKAQTLRTFLIKLSGRQMKWGKSFTNPALLAGLWVFISMQEVLDFYSPEEIAALHETARNFLM